METKTLYRYISGDATVSEKKEVMDWIESDQEHRKEYLSLQKLYYLTIWQDDATVALSDNVSTRSFFTRKLRIRKLIEIAAIFIVAFPIAYACIFWGSEAQKKNAGMQTIYVPAGQRALITLSDNSKVWLNAKTKFTFPSNFDNDNRTVTLDGEGFFCVSQNKQKPFIVRTGQYNIKVLGTEFNVQAYKDNTTFETALLKGSVQIEPKAHGKQIRLEPNNKMNVVDGLVKITPITQYDSFRWKDGLLCFDNNTIGEMFKKLELYFDVTIIAQNKQLLNHRYSGKFRLDDGVEQVLKTLQLHSEFQYEKPNDNNNIIIIK
ncbi:MAG: FecR domain-containing protein [Massilibacteroides sp.]|nr:FecR domain-containing protein [Massilibacteroides sp.]